MHICVCEIYVPGMKENLQYLYFWAWVITFSVMKIICLCYDIFSKMLGNNLRSVSIHINICDDNLCKYDLNFEYFLDYTFHAYEFHVCNILQIISWSFKFERFENCFFALKFCLCYAHLLAIQVLEIEINVWNAFLKTQFWKYSCTSLCLL